MVRKKVTTRVCGKCKTVFPVGRGHNARTCGKVKTDFSELKIRTVSNCDFKTTTEMKGFSKEKLEAVNHATPRGVPRNLFSFVTCELGKVLINFEYDRVTKKYAREYDYIDDGKKKLWFNHNGELHRLDGPAVEHLDGRKEWWADGKRHRLDGPAVEYKSGRKEWWVDGEQHRLNGPAVEGADGHKEWWVGGERHRLDGPAVEHKDGHKEWWVEGLPHREDGPAIVRKNGDKLWYMYGLLHRLDGPAIEYANGHKEWMVNGKRHRLDGPAVVQENGASYWHVEGKPVLVKDSKSCEKAANLETTGEEFFHLAQHESWAVRTIVLNNPACPAEWRVVARLLPPTKN